MKQANNAGMNMTYKEVVQDFTGGRTDSLSDLTLHELTELQTNLSLLSRTAPVSGKKYDVSDSMRKAIISQFLAIGRTAADAIAWAEKNGVFGHKRAFNDYTTRELWQLIRNAEKMKADHIAAVAKKLKEG